MKSELDKLLCDRYPKIFDLRGSSVERCAMGWGFECGDGWFDLLDELCTQIQKRVDQQGIKQVVAHQVKEKYGELRFYHSCGDDVVDLMVQNAEARSEQICEKCGRPGALVESSNGWLQTRCAEHSPVTSRSDLPPHH